MRIVPNIWSNGQAAETAEFYVDTFREAAETDRQHYPTEGLLDFQKPLAGQVLTVELSIHGRPIALVNAGDEFRPNPALGFLLVFDPAVFPDAEAYLHEVHTRLMDGGAELMPLGEYPFSPRYAWVQDRYGVSWQLMLTRGDGDPRPFLSPALMFCGSAQNQSKAAVEKYTTLFPGSRIGTVAEYPQQTGPASAGAVMYSDFRLGGDPDDTGAAPDQWFTAMDSGVEQSFTFTEGVSLMVQVEGQAEIDRLWEALSAHPEAEACGWCKDEFGVSWQIVPADLGQLMARPNAYQKLMGMKKIETAGF